MSITATELPEFFQQGHEFWDHPLARPSFLIEPEIDRLAEDEVPIDELAEDYGYDVIYGGAR